MRVEHWMDAERLAETWMRSSGFPSARMTGGSADAGIDVRAADAIAQVKMETRPVGRPSLQRLVGARGTSTSLRLLFFSSSGYSSAAQDYARSLDIALLTYTAEGVVSPANSHARTIRSARSTPSATSALPSATNVGGILLVALAAILIVPFAVTWGVARFLGASNGWAFASAVALLGLLGVAFVGSMLRSDTKAEAARIAVVRAKRPGPSLFDS